MPGLSIIFDQTGARSNQYLVSLNEAMTDSMMHFDWYKIDAFLDESIGMGRVSLGILNPEPQPIFNEDKSLCIMMEGEIYDYEDLKEELTSKGHKFVINNDPEFILHLYEEYGEECMQKLNGIFVIAIWHFQERKLIIANDRYGFRPLYYAKNNGNFLFASEIKAILVDRAFNRVVNDAGVSDFFYFGFLLGNKTLIKGIELLPPASILTCHAGCTSIKQYWDFFDYHEDSNHSESYYLDTFSSLLQKAVERCCNDSYKKAVSLSGGLDSRAIVACIDKKHYPIHTFTFGTPGCDDARFAQMVAERIGTNHHFFALGPEYLVEYAEKAVWLTDGMLNCIHSHGISALDRRKYYWDIELGGTEGIYTWFTIDQMDKLAWEYSQTQNDEILFQLVFSSLPIAKGSTAIDFMKQLFSESYFCKIKEYPAESLNEIINVLISELSYGSPFKRIDYYNLTQRQRRFTAYGPLITISQIETRMPLFDKDLMDFVFTLPSRFRAEEKHLVTNGLFKHFPGLAVIPWTKTGLPTNASNFQKKVQRVKDLFRRGMRKLFGISFKEPSFVDYNRWMQKDRGLQEFISDVLLSGEAKSRLYFKPEVIDRILKEQFSGKSHHAELIGRLLTFELWNRLFIDREEL